MRRAFFRVLLCSRMSSFVFFLRRVVFVLAMLLVSSVGVGAQAPASGGSQTVVRPGTCSIVCTNGSTRVPARVNESSIRTDEACATRCREVCGERSPAGSFRCDSHSFQALPAGEREEAGGSETTPGGTGRTASALRAGSSCPDFNGVHDPFCGKSIAEIVGNIIKFLLGVAGALFLAMFVYGGVLWLTSGSSDRHEAARQTLVNASVGVLIVILSYTLVSVLVRVLGDLGVSQGNTSSREESAAGEEGGGTGAAGGSAGGRCNTEAVQTSCRGIVERVLPAEGGFSLYRTAFSTVGCTQAATEFCRGVQSSEACVASCGPVCDGIRNGRASDVSVPLPDGALERLQAINCEAECPVICRAAFTQ